MRRFLAGVLAATMVLSLSTTAFAESKEELIVSEVLSGIEDYAIHGADGTVMPGITARAGFIFDEIAKYVGLNEDFTVKPGASYDDYASSGDGTIGDPYILDLDDSEVAASIEKFRALGELWTDKKLTKSKVKFEEGGKLVESYQVKQVRYAHRIIGSFDNLHFYDLGQAQWGACPHAGAGAQRFYRGQGAADQRLLKDDL